MGVLQKKKYTSTPEALYGAFPREWHQQCKHSCFTSVQLHKIWSSQLMPVTSYAYRWMMATQLSQKNVINNGQADIKDNRHLSICKASDANYLIIKSHMLPAPPTMKHKRTPNKKKQAATSSVTKYVWIEKKQVLLPHRNSVLLIALTKSLNDEIAATRRCKTILAPQHRPKVLPNPFIRESNHKTTHT